MWYAEVPRRRVLLRHPVELNALCVYILLSMPSFGLAQDRREVVATQAEAFLNVASNRDFCARPGNSASTCKHPHSAGAIVDLKRAAPSGSIRVGDPSSDGHFPSRVSPGVLIQFGDAHMRRATSQKQAACHHKKGSDESETMK